MKYHTFVLNAHTHAAMHDILLHAHMYEHMHACTVCIRRTRAVVQATHSVTHTKSSQVIHQLIGTNNVQILRETARAEKAELAPAPQLYLPYPGPQPGPPRGYQPAGARSPARTALVWPAARTAPQQIQNSARRCPRAAGRGPKPAPRRALMPTHNVTVVFRCIIRPTVQSISVQRGHLLHLDLISTHHALLVLASCTSQCRCRCLRGDQPLH